MIFLLPLQRTGHYFMSRVTYDQIMNDEDLKLKFIISIDQLEALIKEGENFIHITCPITVQEEDDLEAILIEP